MCVYYYGSDVICWTRTQFGRDGLFSLTIMGLESSVKLTDGSVSYLQTSDSFAVSHFCSFNTTFNFFLIRQLTTAVKRNVMHSHFLPTQRYVRADISYMGLHMCVCLSHAGAWLIFVTFMHLQWLFSNCGNVCVTSCFTHFTHFI